MKCTACDYSDTEFYEKTGMNEFILIRGHFFIEEGYYHEEKRVYLYACPKCDTVIMSKII
jgi:predicted nucleic-acid-binding Zn-ribbon protein